MSQYLYVMIGGAIGALMRYSASKLLAGICFFSMPLGTFIINIIGCFLLGILTGMGEHCPTLPRNLLLMLSVGVCGAFTTFSTFSSEMVKTMETGHITTAIFYAIASVSIGILLFWIGKSWTSA